MGPELFDGFEEVLLDTMLTNWEDIIAPIADADKTPAHFELTLQEMYRKYVCAEATGIFSLNISIPFRSHSNPAF
jgi:hypothetical protein